MPFRVSAGWSVDPPSAAGRAFFIIPSVIESDFLVLIYYQIVPQSSATPKLSLIKWSPLILRTPGTQYSITGIFYSSSLILSIKLLFIDFQ
jgi:hypothetical protein